MVMKKYIVFLSVVVILITDQAYSQDVSINTILPASAEPGGEFTVEVTINKGSIAGFGKLQQNLPEGLIASVIDAKGGNFSFREQVVKIIWMSLPPGTEYTASYKVSVDSDVSGEQTITGKFQYLQNNERTAVELDPSVISIGPGVVVAHIEDEIVVDNDEEEHKRKEEEARKAADEEERRVAEEERRRKENEARLEEERKRNELASRTEVKAPPTTYYKKPKTTSTAKLSSPGPYKYRVQIAASRYPIPNNDPRLANIEDNLTSQKGADGWYRYYSGTYSYLRPAKKRLNEMKDKGIKDAWINIYQGGISGYGNSSGIVYKIQIGAYKFPIPERNLKLLGIDGITSQIDPDGYYRYFAGTYTNRRAAKARLKEVMSKGVTDAWISKI